MPAHEGAPSVASKMYFGFVVVSLLRYWYAAAIASPVGVPFPCGCVAGFVMSFSAPTTAAAFIGATGTTTLLVTPVATHSEPVPSGNVFRPQETAASVSMMTCFSAGRTAFHFSVTPSDVVSSIIDFERSSSSRISAGLRSTSNFCRPHVRPPPPPLPPIEMTPAAPDGPTLPLKPPMPGPAPALPVVVLPLPPAPPRPLGGAVVPAVQATSRAAPINEIHGRVVRKAASCAR